MNSKTKSKTGLARFRATLSTMARPRLPRLQKRARRVTVHLTDEEWRAVQRVAGRQSVSDYLRDLIRAALNLGSHEDEEG